MLQKLRSFSTAVLTACFALFAMAGSAMAQPPAATPEIPIDFSASLTTYIGIFAAAIVLVWAFKMGGSVLVKLTQWLASSRTGKSV